VSNSKRAAMVDGNGKSIYKWQIRIRSEEPTLIEYTEMLYEPDMPMAEVYKLVRRTSYMVEGPNREVWWAVDIWKNDNWECVIDGKSTLQAGAAAS
jgi:hypothetical protein